MKRIALFPALALTLILALSVSLACASGGADVYKKCAGCHGADGSKIASASGDGMLKGQAAADIKTKLKGYVDGSYGGKKAALMQKVASKLSDADIDAVSEYIGTL